MNEYKLSAENTQQIKEFLFHVFNYQWNEITQLAMLNNTDAFVFINGNGLIPNHVNNETGEVLSYLQGLHFDILTKNELEVPEAITRHYPTNPKHQFE